MILWDGDCLGMIFEVVGAAIGIGVYMFYFIALVDEDDEYDNCKGSEREPSDPERAAYRWNALTVSVIMVVCVSITVIFVKELEGSFLLSSVAIAMLLHIHHLLIPFLYSTICKFILGTTCIKSLFSFSGSEAKAAQKRISFFRGFKETLFYKPYFILVMMTICFWLGLQVSIYL